MDENFNLFQVAIYIFAVSAVIFGTSSWSALGFTYLKVFWMIAVWKAAYVTGFLFAGGFAAYGFYKYFKSSFVK